MRCTSGAQPSLTDVEGKGERRAVGPSQWALRELMGHNVCINVIVLRFTVISQLRESIGHNVCINVAVLRFTESGESDCDVRSTRWNESTATAVSTTPQTGRACSFQVFVLHTFSHFEQSQWIETGQESEHEAIGRFRL